MKTINAVYADKRLAAPPLVNLAPDICYYVCGISKSIAPGLQSGFVIAPDLIAQQAIEDGAAEQIIKENQRILKMRGLRLREVLAVSEPPQARCSPHVWLPLSGPEEAARFENRLLDDNVRVTGARVPVLEGAHEFGLRFCIGATRREMDFERALSSIRRFRTQPDERPQRAVI